MIETYIETLKENEYHNITIRSKLIERYSLSSILKTNRKSNTFFYLFQIEESEYKRWDEIYYSSLKSYRIMGLLEKSFFPFFYIFPLYCSKCFTKLEDNYISCSHCKCNFEKDDIPYFININQFIPSVDFRNISEKYKLGFLPEYYSDQRNKLCNPIKEEITELALHPDRILKIVKLSNDSWVNINKYI